MSDDEEDLTGAEIKEFVTKVRSLPGCTNVNETEAEKAAPLFLRARKRDVDRAVELYKANKRMRYTENVDSIDPLEDGVRRELLSGKFTVLPSCVEDQDVKNSPTVAIFTANRHWPPMTTHRDTLKGVLYQLDVAMMDERSQRNGLIVLYDMRDAKYGNFDYHLCIKLLNLFKGVYPARLRKVIIVEAPIWFRAPFGVLRLFVKEKIRDRISTVDIDDIHNQHHLPSTVVQALAHQPIAVGEQRHLDWLRACLQKTGHAALAPQDYFTAPSPIYSSSLTDFDYALLQSSPTRRLPGQKAPRYGGSLRGAAGSQSIRICRRLSNDSPHLPSLVRRHPSEVVTRRDGLNRMLNSMYHTTVVNPEQNNNGVQSSSSSSSVNSWQSDVVALNATDPRSDTRLPVAEFLARVEALGTLGLCAEFDAMFRDRPVQHGTCERFMQMENRRRNRYLDVPCLDSTAVELSDGTYLHANWAHGYKSPRAYILAQGPLDNTRRDFWLAVWEHRVPVVVMLTRIVEGQRVKCAPYWPSRSSLTSNTSLLSSPLMLPCLRRAAQDPPSVSSGEPEGAPASATYGEFLVINIGESMEENGLYRRTRLEVRRRKKDAKRGNKRDCCEKVKTTDSDTTSPHLVDHLLYLGWPDFDVPSDSDGFLKFLHHVKQLHETRCCVGGADGVCCNGSTDGSVGKQSQPPPQQQPPLLIHCSAGIGRTGTFVTVDICLQQALTEGFIDVPGVVSHLRTQRAGAVQVAKQYAFIHTALASSLASKK